MKLKIFAAAAAICATQSFAIIGVGAHYAPSFGNKMDGMKSPAAVTDDGSVLLQHDGFKGTMQGFGFKVWVDILPIFDVEATFNIQYGSYDASFYVLQDQSSIANVITGEGEVDTKDLSLYKEVPLKIELGGVPFGKANPKFVHMNGDLSITYPITFLPIIRPYIGGGITYNLNTFILNKSFTYDMVNGLASAIIDELRAEVGDDADAIANIDVNQLAERIQDRAVDELQDASLDEALNTSIGGHILVGVRAKLPIIPIAAYANFKYYFGGDYPKEIDAGNMAIEIGGGFAL